MNRYRGWATVIVAALMYIVLTPLATVAQAVEEAAATTTNDGMSPAGVFGEIFQTQSDVLYAMLVPGVIVYVLGVLIQPLWSPKLKQGVTYAVCFAVAAVYIQFFSENRIVSWDGLPRVGVITAVIARGYYQLYKGPVTDIEETVVARKN